MAQLKPTYISGNIHVDGNIEFKKNNTTTNLVTELNNKVNTETGKGLSTNDYSAEEKTKVTNANSHISNTSNPHNVTKSQVGLGNVANTGDSATPVSGGTTKFTTGGAYTELAKKADKATTLAGYGITNAYTKTEVDSAIATGVSNLVDSAPAALDTLNELAAALNNDANFANTVTNALAEKATKDVATTSANGLMSSSDKTKLDGIATGANKYTHPSYTAKSSGLYKVTVDATGHVSAATAVAKADITGLGIPAQDTTYSAATTSAAGLMSAADKTKLDGVATGATANVGTITGITMNGSSKGTSGVVDLGTVITEHQSLSGCVPTSRTVNGKALSENISLTASDVGASTIGHTHSEYLTSHQDISGKQDKLTAGTNITISGNTISATGSANTAGSTDTSSKIFLVGATAQADSSQTYSDDEVFATNGVLSSKSLNINNKVTLQYNSTTESLDFIFN